MKALKPILFSALVLASIGSAIFYSSCKKDRCTDVVCVNGGYCDGGNCVCPTGFEGDSCQNYSRNRWVGNYNGGDSCSVVGARGYNIVFLAVLNNPVQMVMRGILNTMNDSAMCTMVAADSFTFNGANNSTTYRGFGKIKNDSLKMSYSVQQDTINYTCKYFGLKY